MTIKISWIFTDQLLKGRNYDFPEPAESDQIQKQDYHDIS